MLSGICLASFLESTVVPIPLETLLVPLMQARREKLWQIAAVTTIGCMLGALVGYAIGYFLFDALRDLIVSYWVSESQIDSFTTAMQRDGFWFIFSTGVTPLPLQVAMLAAGISQYSLALYLLAVVTSRTIRYFGLAVLVYFFGNKTEKLVRKYKWQAGAIGIIVIIGFIGYRIWSA